MTINRRGNTPNYHETPDDAELRRLAEVCQMPDNGPDTLNWWYEVSDLVERDILPVDAEFIAAANPAAVEGLLDRLAHMTEARDAARAEVERLTGQIEAVRAEVATDGAGWVEFIMPKTGTTHIAYVYEGGGTYLPDGELDSVNLLEATARGKAWRMVRATDVLAILDGGAES